MSLARTIARMLPLCTALASIAAPALAQSGNLLTQGRFDTSSGVTGWTTSFSDYGTLAFDSGHDADGCSGSGAAKAFNNAPTDFAPVFYYSTCIAGIVAGAGYEVEAAFDFLVNSGTGYAEVAPYFYSSTDCSGGSSVVAGAGYALPSVAGWQRLRGTPTAPAGAHSVQLSIHLQKNSGAVASLAVLLDEIVLARTSYIFSDNFERASVCRWSAP